MKTERFSGGRPRGQTVTEFALVLPVLLTIILGVIDGGLLMFSVGTARYAASEGSRAAAALGTQGTADSQIVASIRTVVTTTHLFNVSEIDIYKLNQDGNGNLTPDPTLYNRYALDGTPLVSPEPWPATRRNVGNGTSDFIGVTVKYSYTWKAGIFMPFGAVNATAESDVRLEPQSY